MGSEALPGVIDTIEIIFLAIVVSGLLGIVGGGVFITFLYSEKRDLGIVGWLFTTFWYREIKDAEHEEQNGDH